MPALRWGRLVIAAGPVVGAVAGVVAAVVGLLAGAAGVVAAVVGLLTGAVVGAFCPVAGVAGSCPSGVRSGPSMIGRMWRRFLW